MRRRRGPLPPPPPVEELFGLPSIRCRRLELGYRLPDWASNWRVPRQARPFRLAEGERVKEVCVTMPSCGVWTHIVRLHPTGPVTDPYDPRYEEYGYLVAGAREWAVWAWTSPSGYRADYDDRRWMVVYRGHLEACRRYVRTLRVAAWRIIPEGYSRWPPRRGPGS